MPSTASTPITAPAITKPMPRTAGPACSPSSRRTGSAEGSLALGALPRGDGLGGPSGLQRREALGHRGFLLQRRDFGDSRRRFSGRSLTADTAGRGHGAAKGRFRLLGPLLEPRLGTAGRNRVERRRAAGRLEGGELLFHLALAQVQGRAALLEPALFLCRLLLRRGETRRLPLDLDLPRDRGFGQVLAALAHREAR